MRAGDAEAESVVIAGPTDRGMASNSLFVEGSSASASCGAKAKAEEEAKLRAELEDINRRRTFLKKQLKKENCEKDCAQSPLNSDHDTMTGDDNKSLERPDSEDSSTAPEEEDESPKRQV